MAAAPSFRAEVLSSRPYTPKRSASIGIPCIIIPILRVRTPCLNCRSHASIPPPGTRHHDLQIAPSSSGTSPRDPVVTGVPVVPSSSAFSPIAARQSHRRFAPRSLAFIGPIRHTYPISGIIEAPHVTACSSLPGAAALGSSTTIRPEHQTNRSASLTPTRHHRDPQQRPASSLICTSTPPSDIPPATNSPTLQGSTIPLLSLVLRKPAHQQLHPLSRHPRHTVIIPIRAVFHAPAIPLPKCVI